MRASRLMAFALAITVVAVAMIVAGCTTTSTPTPTPAPTATPTPAPTGTPTPTVERAYQFLEKYAAGIENYNAGVGYKNTSNSLFNASDYSNASYYADLAANKMDAAKADFEGMLWYASTNDQTLLSQKWTETADLYSKSYKNASLGAQEYANESKRQTPNYLRGNNYIEWAKHYSNQGYDSWLQATELGNRMTFAVPTTMPVK